MQASVVIRARDEAAAIERTLDLLAAQTVAHELIVVDSGSRDATASIAAEHGASVLALGASEFTFGRALNRGCAHAGAPVIVALSAHAFPPDSDWLRRVLAHFDDHRVACAYGERFDPQFVPLHTAVRQDAAMLAANPFWGFSNSAGAFRATLWRARQFREDLPGTEDREWSRWALEQGYVCVLDPTLAVHHDHSRDSVRASFARYEREQRGFAMFLDLPPYRVTDALAEWWQHQGGHRTPARARLDPRRAARLAGKWCGRRAAGSEGWRAGRNG